MLPVWVCRKTKRRSIIRLEKIAFQGIQRLYPRKICYNNETTQSLESDTEISGAGKVKEVADKDRRVGPSALGKDCDFLCDPGGLDALSMGFDKPDLHTPNPLDKGSEDKIREKLSSAEITKWAEKDKDLNSSKGDLEEQGVLNPNGNLELRGIHVFCSHNRGGHCRPSGKSKASIVDGGSNLAWKNFELPEFHNVFKVSRLKKKKIWITEWNS
ncbi:hypothetical protein V6N13_142275 [Hibiscus sabdariffa]|uniref:Uncharacterized protein n=1 Tax=Hibiscus sabdariffa TaxID=183260 RepID=A0ABR2FE41_9ROSI